MRKRIDYIIYFVLVALGIYGVRALFNPYFFESHDSMFHLSKLAQLVTLFKEGVMPPRWSGTLNGRLGYPVFVFSYPLPFLLSSIFYFLGFGLGGSLKWVFGLSYIASGIGAYLLLREYFSKPAALTGAIFFLYAPYRFSLIFVRGAIGETLAYTFLPFVLLFLTRSYKKSSLKNSVYSSIFISLATLSHSLFLPMYLPLIVAYSVGLPFIMDKRPQKALVIRHYKRVFLSLVLAAILSSFYLFPLILERKYTVFDQVYRSETADHLVSLWQLIRSPWGYGPSLPGSQQDLMSFQIGLAQIATIGGIIGIYLVTKIRVISKLLSTLGVKIEEVKGGACRVSTSSLVVFFLAAIVMIASPFSVWFWNNVPGFSFIDFPWRYLGLTTLAASVLAAYLTQSFNKKWLISGLLIAASIISNRNHMRINLPLQVNEREIFSDTQTTTTADEFMPVWRQSGRSRINFGSKVETLEGGVNLIENKNQLVVFETDSDTPVDVQFNNLYFPGWKGYIMEGGVWRQLEIGQDIEIVDDAWGEYTRSQIQGTMRIHVPQGRKTVMMKFSESNTRLVGDLISLISTIAVFMYLGYWGKKKI